jgi:hypothetical protein
MRGSRVLFFERRDAEVAEEETGGRNYGSEIMGWSASRLRIPKFRHYLALRLRVLETRR